MADKTTTADDPTTNLLLHGHGDDRHSHDGAGTRHGHKKTESLGRTASVDEWVSPSELGWQEALKRGDVVGTDPTQPYPPIEQRKGAGPPALRQHLDGMTADAIHANLRVLAGMVEFNHAESERRTRLDADLEALVDGTGLLAEGFTHAREVGYVPDELKRRFLALARTWAPNGGGTS